MGMEHAWVGDGLLEAPLVDEFGYNGLVPVVSSLLGAVEGLDESEAHAFGWRLARDVDVDRQFHVCLEVCRFDVNDVMK